VADFGTVLRKLWPNGNQKQPGLVEGIIASAPKVFAKHGITSPLVIAHIMAQISHECGAGHEIIENLNYSAGRLMQVWPSRFPTMSAAQPYANNGRALADKIYNGRMGNRTGTDDGWNFRGRGGSQTTGREGYERVAKATGLDVVNNPDLLIAPATFLECAVSDFVNCGCLPYATADNLNAVTVHLNGGYIGLSERRVWLSKWKAALPSVTFETAPTPAHVILDNQVVAQTPSIKSPANGSIGAKVASWWSSLVTRKV
jgi:putative chitinase